MGISELSTEQLLRRNKTVHAEMNHSIEELFQIQEEIRRRNAFEEDSCPLVVVEHLTIVGYQWSDEQGGRHGDVSLLYKDASIPTYIARGLIASGRSRIEQSALRQTVFGLPEHEEDDDRQED